MPLWDTTIDEKTTSFFQVKKIKKERIIISINNLKKIILKKLYLK